MSVGSGKILIYLETLPKCVSVPVAEMCTNTKRFQHPKLDNLVKHSLLSKFSEH